MTRRQPQIYLWYTQGTTALPTEPLFKDNVKTDNYDCSALSDRNLKSSSYTVNFINSTNAGYARPIASHLGIPVVQVFVRVLPGGVEYQDACVGLEGIKPMMRHGIIDVHTTLLGVSLNLLFKNFDEDILLLITFKFIIFDKYKNSLKSHMKIVVG